jgi:predicted nucleic acid-binding protein
MPDFEDICRTAWEIFGGDISMTRIYLDNCCYNRPFDDQSYMRINLETQAKLHIQQLIVQKKLGMVCSFVSRYENSENPDSANRDSIENFLKNAVEYIGYADIAVIRKNAFAIMNMGIKMKDAAHLACAIKAKCDCLITTDDQFIKKYSGTEILVCNPITFLENFEESENA